jgi:hypothetical protein
MRVQTLASICVLAGIVSIVSAVGCGGPQDGPPKPLSKRFDDMYIAAVPVTEKPAVIKTQNDWSVAKMEKAKADADLAEAGVLLDVAKNEREATRLDEKSAQSRKAAADQSADQNRVNAAMKEIRGAELARKAADERVKYLESYREWLKVLGRFTEHQMYWREAQYELAKAKIARDKNIQPKGFLYEDFVKQEQDRARKSADGRTKSERARSKAFEARTRWLSLQGESDKLLGKKSTFPDPLAPKPVPGGDATQGAGGYTQSTGGGQ